MPITHHKECVHNKHDQGSFERLKFLALTLNDGRPNEKKSTIHAGRAAFEPLLLSALHDM